MSSTPLCAKCKSWIREKDDSWCIGCTAASELQSELQKTWSAPLRRIGHDIVIAATRQLKALRSAGVAIHSKAHSDAARKFAGSQSAGIPRADSKSEAAPPAATVEEDHRQAIPRRRTTTPKSAARDAVSPKQEPSTYSSSDPAEEEEEGPQEPSPIKRKRPRSPPVEPDHRPLATGGGKPPEPDGPPPGHHRATSPRQDKPKDSVPRLTEAIQKDRRDRDRHTKRKHRAGRKHQRLYRLLEQPDKVIHQRRPESFWALEETLEAQDLQ